MADNLEQNLNEKLLKMQKLGYRIFAFGYLEISNSQNFDSNLEKYLKNIKISGLIGFQDPPRKKIKSIINSLTKSQISTVMITGDNFHTGFAIAKNVGIIKDNSYFVDASNWKKDNF
ncbi:Calcium-transporting ATPase [Salmonella enterica subsp. enterica serovar Typhimurium str. DT104]|nr:Calcium-transporting ATPase [Salmonella enterica subsp. enterica serovar Typhimurium str. DT104]